MLKLRLGEALLEQGSFDEAEAETRRALELIPANHPQYAGLAIRLRSLPQLRAYGGQAARNARSQDRAREP